MNKKKVNDLLRRLRKKSKKALLLNTYTEFFAINTRRKVIEFLTNNRDELLYNVFFKEFLPREIKDFCNLRIVNDVGEEIRNWYYDDENLLIKVDINWGFGKQEIAIEIDVDNFCVSLFKDEEVVARNVDIELLSEFLVSFAVLQAEKIAITYNKIGKSLKRDEIHKD